MILILLLFLSAVPLSAEVAEPEEPEIVLPEVILQIEDLSTELIEAGLPGEEELLPPPLSRELPVPEEEELRISEPVQPLETLEPGPLLEAERGSSLAAQAVLGAGSMNHNFSSIILYRVGEEPRFRLKFLHEMLDGFGGQPAGAGFNFREDSLEGGVKFHIANLEVNAEAWLKDIEQGLQGKGPLIDPPVSRVFRQGRIDFDLIYPLNDVFSLGGAANGVLSSQLLTGSSPQSKTELVIAPEILAKAQWERTWLGLNTHYHYRYLLGSGLNQLHRLRVNALAGVEFSNSLKLEGSGGWFWSEELGSKFPFELILSGTPFSSFTFRACGGYRLQEIDFYQVLSEYPLCELPAVLRDNHGWFGELGAGFSIVRNLSLQAGVLLARNCALPDPDLAVSPDSTTTGLFPFRQREGTGLATNFGLKWNILKVLDLSTALESEFLYRPEYRPEHLWRTELGAAALSGRWGAKASLLFQFGMDFSPSRVPIPLLELSGFFNLNETVAFLVEGKDLLYPFIEEGLRYSWKPFEAPGLRATFKIQITL